MTAQQLREIHSLGKSTRETLVSARQFQPLHSHGIRFAGQTLASHGYRFVRHAPDFHQILAVTSGHGRVWTGEGWKACGQGQSYVTPAGHFCAYETARGSRWHVCWVIFDPDSASPSFARFSQPCIVPADTLALQHAVSGLCHEALGEGEPAAIGLWSSIVHHQSLRILQQSGTDHRLERLWQLVNQELGADWTLDRLAGRAGMSAESLRRLCLEHHGNPPLAHLTRLRMQYAADLLARTREKVATIATRVGYQDPFAFSNAFKRVIGHPPSKQRSITM